MFGSGYFREKTLALAGSMQALVWVDETATHGSLQDATGSIDANLALFLSQDPAETEQAIKQILDFQTGLRVLARLSSPLEAETQRQLGYLIQLVQVATQFSRNGQMMQRVGEELPRIASLENDRETRLQAIGELYEQTISTLETRIQVQGAQGYLRQPDIATNIRALLFLSIRFLLLWQQQGGKRIDFLLRRNSIAGQASDLLRSVTH